MTNIIGAIAGDVIGSVYEWFNVKTEEEVSFFDSRCKPTDDSVLTCAVADWLLATSVGVSDEESRRILEEKLDEFGHAHPNAGYGHMFRDWLIKPIDMKEPLNSFGNGSGMRCSAVGFWAKSYKEVLDLAKKSAEVTHNHPEGIKGAQAIAACIYLARLNSTKEYIRERIGREFGYDLNRKIKDIAHVHKFDATCQVTVPEAIICFLESNSYEDAIRKAISIGGDSDTIACMAGGIAGAYYGVPAYIAEKTMSLLPNDLFNVVVDFEDKCNRNNFKN